MDATIERLVPKWGMRDGNYGTEVDAVWGARWIAPDDMVPNRQDLQARNDDAEKKLVTWLNGIAVGQGALRKALDEARRIELGTGHAYMVDYDTSGKSDDHFILYEDSVGRIEASPQASHGYVYVVGYLK